MSDCCRARTYAVWPSPLQSFIANTKNANERLLKKRCEILVQLANNTLVLTLIIRVEKETEHAFSIQIPWRCVNHSFGHTDPMEICESLIWPSSKCLALFSQLSILPLPNRPWYPTLRPALLSPSATAFSTLGFMGEGGDEGACMMCVLYG